MALPTLLDLFDDLEQQAAGLAFVQRDAEVADLAEAEYAQVDLSARLHASVGRRVVASVPGDRLAGTLDRVGADFLLLDAGHAELVVPTAAILTVNGLAPAARVREARPLTARLGLTSMLRRLASERVGSTFVLRDGGRVDGPPERVGTDFVEVAGGCVVPCSAIAFVRVSR